MDGYEQMLSFLHADNLDVQRVEEVVVVLEDAVLQQQEPMDQG